MQRLAALDDDRAKACAAALSDEPADLGCVQAALDADNPEEDTAGALLLELINLPLPSREQLETAVGALKEATARRDDLAVSAAEADHRRAGLLRQALDAHDHRLRALHRRPPPALERAATVDLNRRAVSVVVSSPISTPRLPC